MEYQDELPCGGFANEDTHIEEEMKQISEGKECEKQECGDCECVKEEEAKPIVAKLCKKCGKQRAVLLYKGESICQLCLFKNIEYKSRLLLENTFRVGKLSNILVCHSGGLNSICMLNILIDLVKRYQKNKLFNKLGCIHIQQQSTLPEGYRELFFKTTGVELVVIPIEAAFEREGASLGDVKKLMEMFNKTANTIDLVTILRDRLIQDYAQQHDFHFVMKGLNGQTLAAEAFKYFAKGLGGNLPSLCPSEAEKGPFYYPLRNNLQKELQYYYYIKKLSVLAIKSQQDNIENHCSSGLDSHIKKFMDTLQNMYSHTAPAIVRTTEKIQANLPSKQRCGWCKLPGAEGQLCRRCQRLWQARKKTTEKGSLPGWMGAV